MKKYGLKNADGTTNTPRKDHVSSVLVSVLLAGAFFGALASAPVSGKHAFTSGIAWVFNSSPRRYVEQLVLEGRKPYLHSALSSRSVL